ncbi:MAG: hypothetical protein JWQ40_2142 [Segetibacter sp.]|nr:hypothetical protein [Segetibacter sp.]
MSGDIFLSLFKVQATFLILVKVVLLLKYFMFVKYKTNEWRAIHLIYFPNKDIMSSSTLVGAKVKKTQNQLTIAFVLLNIGIVFIRSLI